MALDHVDEKGQQWFNASDYGFTQFSPTTVAAQLVEQLNQIAPQLNAALVPVSSDGTREYMDGMARVVKFAGCPDYRILITRRGMGERFCFVWQSLGKDQFDWNTIHNTEVAFNLVAETARFVAGGVYQLLSS